MTVEAVVFDLDGTLLDTMTSVPLAYAQAIRERGGPGLTPDQVVAAWHVGPAPVVLAHFLGRAVTDGDLECFHDRIEVAAESARPFAGIAELLQALRCEGHALAVFTSATGRIAAPMLAGTGLREYFPIVVTGDMVASPKPAPDGLLDTCRLLGVPATATAYVGDSSTDLRCAQTAGAMPIHARWSLRTVDTPQCSLAECSLAAHHPRDVLTLIVAATAQH